MAFGRKKSARHRQGGAFLVAALLLLVGCAGPAERANTRPWAPSVIPTPVTPSPAPTFPLVPAQSPPTATTPVTPTVHAIVTAAISVAATPPANTPAPVLRPITVTAAPLATTKATAAPIAASRGGPWKFSGPRDRIGLAVPFGPIDRFAWGASQPGWYLNWQVAAQPAALPGTQFAQMVRLHEDGFRPPLEEISATARQRPGSLWLIGNEPDVPEQDNVTPVQYATSYHTLYTALKAADPSAQVAIGGVAQPTPLRLVYLDRILSTYQGLYGKEMPVDVWNVHAFILREERGSWGVGIPRGLDVDQGQLYEVADHANLEIFRGQIIAFRRWMAQRGFQGKPLIVTEYGILMPADYGFPLELVSQFMAASFDFFLSATDPQLGDPADGYRLVQAFCWYSAADKMFPTSNLFDPESGTITPLGEAYKVYIARLK